MADGAVRDARAGGVDVTNSFSFTRTTPGWTSAPDLKFLTFDSTAPALTATFTFDEPVVGAPRPSSFHLYRRDGREWDAQSCTLTSSQDGETPVSCTFPSNAANALCTVFIATVDGRTVQDANGRTNPEGTAYGLYRTSAADPYQTQCS
ncbi:MAG TPA: hypothetical protein VFJ19_10130 [Nocardioidaceae bacterium]|nr:hypothetical protein [Nocardioidaceae bacterium]